MLSGRIRKPVVLLAATVTTLGIATAVPVAAQPPTGPSAAAAKVEPALMARLDGNQAAATVIEFAPSADLGPASHIKDWTRRGQAVVDALQATARSSQAAVVAELDRQGVPHTSFWVDNTVYLPGGTQRLALAAAADPNVRTVRAADEVPLERPVAAKAERAAADVEWGVANIKADQVWSTLGDRGEGVIVANIDSGVQFDHPALVASYRGNRGDGSFEHDYNWWDPAGICATPAPCDNNDHGTHTMGTMVGDGGAGNRIGVAPGARWIAAKGCESNGCSEFALSSSAQWVLAPTDLSGQNPDPGKRPDVINNSWGSSAHSDWYLDFVRAWVASGMFPAFAAGNDGPDCGTAGSPGDYDEAYAVGNYAVDGTISPTSSRGAADRTTKPDISAPGTNVRSSVPGGRYAAFSGTSMATPHLAATVALMWSRSPALVGDVEGTRQLLDDTARDKADPQCGGTPEDNNVYGEGELDALAAVSAVPVGNVGTVSGTVTDAATGQPVAGALLSFTGPTPRNATTRADGSYRLSLTEGTYELTVTLFGYHTVRLGGVVVTGGSDLTRDVDLTKAPLVRLSGRVGDASGHGWPLYAKVVAEGTPVSTFTDPATGRYSMQLPSDATYTVDVEPQYPGYVARSESVALDGDSVHDYDLTIDAASCTAPGYRRGAAGLHQGFDGRTAPRGWTVLDPGGNGQAWHFDDPGRRGNRTGGDGGFAVVDSYFYGHDGLQNTVLVSPPTNLSAVADPVLEFHTAFKSYFHDRVGVDLSVDGGTTWTNVWRPSADVQGLVRVPLPAAARQASVQVRFQYGPIFYGWWWQLDDVYVGSSGCEKAPGGLLVGRTASTVTGKPLGGVEVSADAGAHATSTADGSYWLFAAGRDRYTASLEKYTDAAAKVQVRDDAATRHDFALKSGRLTAPPTVTATVEQGGTATVEIDLANTGDQPATYTLTEAEPDGVVAGPAGNPSDGQWAKLPNYPLTVIDPVVDVYRGRLYSFTGGKSIKASYMYDPAEQKWTPRADIPVARESGIGAYVGGGRFVVTGGMDGDRQPIAATSLYDADTDTWTSGADIPAPVSGAGRAVLDGKLYVIGGCTSVTCGSRTVLRYDPASDRWTKLADFPYAIARSSCGGIGVRVYCAGGTGPDVDSMATWAYTPATDTWQRVADMPQDMSTGASAVAGDELVVSGGVTNHSSMISDESHAYDPALNRWRTLPNRNQAMFETSGACGLFNVGGTDGEGHIFPAVEQLPGFGDCALPAHVAWLSVDHPTRTVAPGHGRAVRVTFDAARVSGPGTYTATLRVGQRTPYPIAPIAVRLVVTPRR